MQFMPTLTSSTGEFRPYIQIGSSTVLNATVSLTCDSNLCGAKSNQTFMDLALNGLASCPTTLEGNSVIGNEHFY